MNYNKLFIVFIAGFFLLLACNFSSNKNDDTSKPKDKNWQLTYKLTSLNGKHVIYKYEKENEMYDSGKEERTILYSISDKKRTDGFDLSRYRFGGFSDRDTLVVFKYDYDDNKRGYIRNFNGLIVSVEIYNSDRIAQSEMQFDSIAEMKDKRFIKFYGVKKTYFESDLDLFSGRTNEENTYIFPKNEMLVDKEKEYLKKITLNLKMIMGNSENNRKSYYGHNYVFIPRKKIKMKEINNITGIFIDQRK